MPRDNSSSGSSSQDIVISTFLNSGNTCYINSFIQQLMHIGVLRGYITEFYNQGKLKEDGFCYNLYNLYRGYHREPSEIRLQTLNEYIRNQKRFGFHQHDVAELCMTLIDDIDRESSFSVGDLSLQIKDIYREAYDEWMKNIKGKYSIAKDLFCGQEIHMYQCSHCKSQIKSYQEYSILSIPIPETKTNDKTIQQCVDKYYESEMIDDYKCEKCGMKGMRKMIKSSISPKILFVQLNRFWGVQKNCCPIQIGEKLDMRSHSFSVNTSDPMATKTYSLRGFICHTGNIHGGHYYTVVRHGNQYIEIDDNVARLAPNKDAYSSQAYIAIYQVDHSRMANTDHMMERYVSNVA